MEVSKLDGNDMESSIDEVAGILDFVKVPFVLSICWKPSHFSGTALSACNFCVAKGHVLGRGILNHCFLKCGVLNSGFS